MKTYRLMIAAAVGLVLTMTVVVGSAAPGRQDAPDKPRFDELVRADFFAGLDGNAAAMDRAMRLIEATLAKNPRHPEALVWHGSALLGRGAHACEQGDATTGDDLFQRGLDDMNLAVSLSPDNVGVLIPRGATLLEVSRVVPDANLARTLLATAVADYERVLDLQTPYFTYLSEHARGELLFGLAEGLHRLGERQRARTYFERLGAEAKGSAYATRAEAWLRDPAGASATQGGCAGCHTK